MNIERVTAIVIPGGASGSGYLISGRLLLASAHVLGRADRCRVRFASELMHAAGFNDAPFADVVWRGNTGDDAHDDIVVLRLKDEAQLPSATFDPVWGDISSTDLSLPCRAVGFPVFQDLQDRRIDTDSIEATTRPHANIRSGLLNLTLKGRPRAKQDWSGMSGAGVFVGSALVAILKSADVDRMKACPLVPLLADNEFQKAIGVTPTVRRLGLDTRSALDLGHWDPRSRGVEGGSVDYFTGRERALSDILAWLQGGVHSICAVTGGPGSGKSAVLAQIVMQGHPQAQAHGSASAAPKVSTAFKNIVDVAIHARDLSVSEIASSIAAQVGVEADSSGGAIDPARLLPERHARWVIVIDALDEAVEPKQVARELLRPLARANQVRLLVGTRRSMLKPLGIGVREIDLDTDMYFEKTDLARYIGKLFRCEDDPAQATPYRNDTRVAHRVATQAAQRAGRTFLVARLVAESLRYRGDIITDDVMRAEGFPDNVSDAFDQYLDRLGDKKSQAVALLTPLAFARGSGLTVESWWNLSRAVWHQDFALTDVTWLIETLSPYLRESKLDAQVTYRLYHEALGEHLRELHAPMFAIIESAFLDFLQQSVPDSATGEKDWSQLQARAPYAHRHLATHAAAAGKLDEFTADPHFLVNAESNNLLEALRSVAGRNPEAQVYQKCYYQLRGLDGPDALAQLYLCAHQSNTKRLIEAIRTSGDELPWATLWTQWHASATHQVIKELDGGYPRTRCTELNGLPVVFAQGQDQPIRVIDPDIGDEIAPPIGEGDIRLIDVSQGTADNLILCQAENKMIILSSDMITLHTVALSDAARIVAAKLIRHTSHLLIVIVNGHDIKVIDAASGDVVAGPVDCGPGRVRCIDAVASSGFHAVVTGNDRGVVVARRLDNLDLLYDPITAQRGSIGVSNVLIANVDSHLRLFIAGHNGPIQVHDVETGERLATAAAYGSIDSPENNDQDLVFTLIGGDPVICSATYRGFVRVLDARNLKARIPILTGHNGPISSIETIELDGEISLITSGDDQTIRRWNLQQLLTDPQAQPSETKKYITVGYVYHAGVPAAVLGTFNTATLVNLGSGELIQEIDLKVEERGLFTSTYAKGDNGITVFSSTTQKHLLVWDLITGETLFRIGPYNGMPSKLALDQSQGFLAAWADIRHYCCMSERHGDGVVEASASAIAVGYIASEPSVAVAKIGAETQVQLMAPNLTTQRYPPIQHDRKLISALAIVHHKAEDVIWVGDDHGSITAYRPTGERLHRVELGARVLSLAMGLKSTLIVCTKHGAGALRFGSDG